jgi:hypothetical protein
MRLEQRACHSRGGTVPRAPCRARGRALAQPAVRARRPPRAAAAGQEAPPRPEEDAIAHASVSTSGRRAVLRAAHAAAVPVEERGRPLAEYMTLPASQYSVLDARRIERLGDDSFRCHVGELRLFNLRVEPVLTVRVDVGPRGPTVRLLGTRLEGSRAAVAANDRFSATMGNEVWWREAAGGGGALELASDAEIQVSVEVPGWFVLPVSVLERTGESCAASRATCSSPARPALSLRPLISSPRVRRLGGDEACPDRGGAPLPGAAARRLRDLGRGRRGAACGRLGLERR